VITTAPEAMIVSSFAKVWEAVGVAAALEEDRAECPGLPFSPPLLAADAGANKTFI
jgi:hypothetical protein